MSGVAARYKRNMDSFSAEELRIIAGKRVCIIGCGGLGGYAANGLARFGVGALTLVDGDVFEETNLNRQLFSSMESIGEYKAEVAKRELKKIDPQLNVESINLMLSGDNAEEIISGHDIVVDCLDNITTRFMVEKACGDLGIPMVYGAIAGFYGQVAVILPKEKLLEKIYPLTQPEKGVEQKVGNPVFIPQIVSAIQISETLKVLAGRENYLKQAVLYMDLLANEFLIIPL